MTVTGFWVNPGNCIGAKTRRQLEAIQRDARQQALWLLTGPLSRRSKAVLTAGLVAEIFLWSAKQVWAGEPMMSTLMGQAFKGHGQILVDITVIVVTSALLITIIGAAGYQNIAKLLTFITVVVVILKIIDLVKVLFKNLFFL